MARGLLLALLAFAAGTLVALPTGARLGVAFTFGTLTLLAMLLFLMLHPFPTPAPDAGERNGEKGKATPPAARGRKAKAERRTNPPSS